MLFDTNDPVVYICRIISLALIIVLLVIFLVVGGWMIFFGRMSDGKYLKNSSTDLESNGIVEGEGTSQDLDSLDTITFEDSITSDGDVTDAEALKILNKNIKNWMNNGSPVSDKNVMNILLIGNDADSTRADAMLLVSINHNTKVITLTSIMRDQYSYIVHDNKGAFEKLHHACAYGGPKLQIEMLEKYYKISIDNYAVVNFETLPKVINKMGGVDVTLTKAEADYMRVDWYCSRLKKAGDYCLNGDEALIYMRIRHGVGGDEGRVNRQQTVMKKILSSLKTYNKAALIGLIGEISPYIRTGYTSTQMMGLATDALSGNWLKYEIKQATFPTEDKTAVGFTVKNSSGQKIWYWKVDYPLVAQQVQLELYGKTNIKLSDNRKSWIS